MSNAWADSESASQKTEVTHPKSNFLIKKVLLDGVEYTYRDLLIDFIQIAYPKYLWFDDPLNRGRGALLVDFYSRKKNGLFVNYPDWLVEYVLRERGSPVFDAVNKWSKEEITVGVGWPLPSATKENVSGFADVVSAAISSIAEDVSSSVGKPVEFVPRERETASNFAKIRIVDGDQYDFFLDNKFKRSGRNISIIGTPLAGAEWDYARGVQQLEGLFIDAIRFSPLSRAQVDGYFISDKNNNIDFAVCYIWPNHSPGIIKGLVTECLIRAMGLPEMPLHDRTGAFLGHWNESYDRHAKRYILDGEGVNLDWGDFVEAKADAQIAGDVETVKYLEAILNENPSAFPRDLIPSILSSPSPREYDRAMLSLLYCPNLSAGMPRAEVIEELVSSRACWKYLDTSKE